MMFQKRSYTPNDACRMRGSNWKELWGGLDGVFS